MAGNEALLRVAFERALGVEGSAYRYPRWASETLKIEPTRVPDPNIEPGGDESRGEILQLAGGGDIVGTPDSESYIEMRVQHHGYYEQSLPAAGVHLYELRRFNELTDVMPAHYIGSLNGGVWRAVRDNPTEWSWMGGKVNVFKASVDANNYLTYTHSLIFMRDSYMRQPTEIDVNVAWTGEWRRRGLRAGGDENGDEYNFKISTPGAVGVAKLVFGKNGVYGATEYLIVDGWMTVYNADDTPAGIDFQIRPIPGGVFTLDDEFAIDALSPKPVRVAATRPKLNANNLDIEVVVGARTLVRTIKSFELTMTEPLEGDFGIGSAYAQDVIPPENDARRSWEVSFAWPYEDHILEQAIRSGALCTAYAKFTGQPIGSTGFHDFSEFTLPSLELTGGGATVTGPGRQTETAVLRAFAVPGQPTMTERHQNTLASIAPA